MSPPGRLVVCVAAPVGAWLNIDRRSNNNAPCSSSVTGLPGIPDSQVETESKTPVTAASILAIGVAGAALTVRTCGTL
jgi:hypothetical protein